MRKLKVLIASMIGTIALVFACVVGTRVTAATNYILNAASSSGSTSGATIYEKSSTTNHSAQTGFTLLMPNNAGKYYSLQYDSTATDVIITKTFTLKSTKALTVTFNMTASSSSAIGNNKTLTMTSDKATLTDNVLTSANSKMQTWTHTYSENETITITASSYAAIKNIYYEAADSSTDENANKDISLTLATLEPSKLAAETSDRAELKQSELDSIFTLRPTSDVYTDSDLYENNGVVSSPSYIKRGTTSISSVEVKNGGFKFTLTSSATLTANISSTGSSKNSWFALFDSQGNSVDCSNSLTKATDHTNYYKVSGTTAVEIEFNLSAGTYYFVSDDFDNRGGRILSLEITTDVTAKLQRQVSTDGTAIRFVATLEGFDATKLSKIESLTYTIKVTGYKAFTKNTTSVYTSITSGNQTICAYKQNTYYCSYSFINLITENNKSLVGANISAYLTITLEGGSTITTNSVGYDIVEVPANNNNGGNE